MSDTKSRVLTGLARETQKRETGSIRLELGSREGLHVSYITRVSLSGSSDVDDVGFVMRVDFMTRSMTSSG